MDAKKAKVIATTDEGEDSRGILGIEKIGRPEIEQGRRFGRKPVLRLFQELLEPREGGGKR